MPRWVSSEVFSKQKGGIELLSKTELVQLKILLKTNDFHDLFEKIKKDEIELKNFILQKENQKRKIKEGLNKAKKEGVKLGRKKMLLNNEKVEAAILLYESKKISSRNAASMIGVSQSTFLKIFEEKKVNNHSRKNNPRSF